MSKSGTHPGLTRPQKRVINRISGKLVTWAKDNVRAGDMDASDARSVGKFAQAILRNRPHMIRSAVTGLTVPIPHSLVAEAEQTLGRSLS